MRKLDRPYTDPSYLFRHGGAAAPGLLDFSASINPLGPSPLVLQAIQDALPTIARYPDPECRELTDWLEGSEWLEPGEVVVGNGSNELIHAITRAFQPRRVAIVEPTYTEYLRAALLIGAEVDHWLAEGEDFTIQPFDAGAADLVWLCNPNSPTGQVLSGSMHSWLRDFPKTMFVVDAAFEQMMIGKGAISNWQQIGGLPPNLIKLKSLTKCFALPGLRLGYATGRVDLIEKVRRQIVPWSVNTLAQVAGVAAMGDFQASILRSRLGYADEVAGFRSQLAAMSRHVHVVPGQANFVLLRLLTITAPALCARLAERGIAIRDASNFVGLDERYVRIAVRTPADNQRLLTELKSILEG